MQLDKTVVFRDTLNRMSKFIPVSSQKTDIFFSLHFFLKLIQDFQKVNLLFNSIFTRNISLIFFIFIPVVFSYKTNNIYHVAI